MSYYPSFKSDNRTYHWGALQSEKFENHPVGNFRKVSENFYRGAQPGIDETRGGLVTLESIKRDIKLLRDEYGVGVILNLRNLHDNNTAHIELEKQAIKELNEEAASGKTPKLIGLNVSMDASSWNNIPVKSEDVEKILGYFQEHSDKKFYVHCRSGNDRTGVVTALYRIWAQDKNVKFNDIRQEMLDCGHARDWYPGLIPSLAACIRYMATSGNFRHLENADQKPDFLWDFYQSNKSDIKKIASAC